MALKQMSTNLDNRLIQKKLFCLNVQVEVFFSEVIASIGQFLACVINIWIYYAHQLRS
jgi:hypothetical protein